MKNITNPALSDTIKNNTGIEFFNKFLPNLIGFLFVVASIIAFFLLIAGAIRFLTSGGDKAGTEAAKEQITHALVGLFLVFAAYAIIGIVGAFFNMDLTILELNKIMLQWIILKGGEKMKKALLSLSGTAALMTSQATTVFGAADKNINLMPASSSQWSGIAGLSIGKMLSALVQLIMVISALIFFFMLVIGGIQYIASGGEKAGTEAAKNRITAALIGLVIVFSAWAITALLEAFFGINILNVTIPTINGN